MNVLYITYDGILDQLGGSQILPYIYGIAKNKNKVHTRFVKTNHPLTTGFVIQDVKKDSKHNAIFYSLLSFDFYFCPTLGAMCTVEGEDSKTTAWTEFAI